MAERRKRRLLPEEDMAVTFADIINNPITRVDLSFLKADEQGGAIGYAPITAAPLVEAAEPVIAPALQVAVPTSLAAADSTVSAATPDSIDSGIVPTEDSNTVPTAVPDRSALATLTTPDSDLTPVTESLEYENQEIFPFEVRPEFQQVAGPFVSRTDKTIVSAAGSDTTDPGTIPAIHSSTVSSTDSARSDPAILPKPDSDPIPFIESLCSGTTESGTVPGLDSGTTDTGISQIDSAASTEVATRDRSMVSDLSSTGGPESELVPMGISGDIGLSVVGMWITETGKMVPKGRVTKVGYVQDVLSAYEQLVYNVLWLAKPKVDLRGFKYPTLMSTVGEYKLVRASYDDLKNVSKLGKNTVIRIIETLIQKDCVEIEQLADIFKRQSTIYRVYSFKAVRLRRLQKDHIYAAKLGKTFSFVRPVQAVYSTTLDPGTIPDGDLGTMSVPGTKSVPIIEPGTMPVTGTTYKGIKFQGTKDNLTTTTIDSSTVYTCFADYAPMVDQEAVARLITTSVAIAPDITTGELLAALQEKGLLVAKLRTEITNPVGFLLSVVPKCFLGAAFKLWRQRRREALRLEGLENEMQLKRDALDEQLRSVPSDNPWQRIRSSLRERIDPHTYQTWFAALRYVRIDGRALIMAVPSDEFLAVIMRFEEDILTEIGTLNLPIDSVAFVTYQELIEQINRE